MRATSLAVLVLVLFASCTGLSAQAAPEKKETKYQSGAKHEEYEVFAGKRHGIYKKWSEKGTLTVEGNYFADAMHGRWTYFHENGAKSLEGEYFAGLKHGGWSAFHSNGNQAEVGEFKNGLREGEATTWFADGQLQSRGRYVDGAEDGLWVRWYAGGSKALEAEYVKGAQTGLWREWGNDGILAYEGRKLNGVEVAVSVRPGRRGTEGITEYLLCSAMEGSGLRGESHLVDGREQGIVTVILTRTRLPQVLVLCAYEPTLWKIELGNSVELKKVILGGFYDQEVTGLPKNVQVVAKFASKGDTDKLYPGGDDREPNGRPREPGAGLQDAVEKFLGHPLTLTSPTAGTQAGVVFGRTAERQIVAAPGSELHVVGCYEGAPPAGKKRRFQEKVTGDANVEVTRKSAPLVLVLCAYDSVHWHVTLGEGVEISTVLLSGYYKQDVTGLPDGVTVHSSSYEDRTLGDRARYFYCYKQGSREYTGMCTTLRDMTGLEVSSFIGAYQLSEAKVEVSNVKAPPPPLDAELHVVSCKSAQGEVVPGGAVKVRLSRTGAPVVLVLLAEKDTTWKITLDAGVNLERVILGGKGKHSIKDRPASTYVVHCSSDHNDGAVIDFQDVETAQEALKTQLRKLVDLDVTSFNKADDANLLTIK